jgi:hypothetical protein
MLGHDHQIRVAHSLQVVCHFKIMLTTDDIFHHLFQTLWALLKAGFARTAIDVNSDIIELLIGGGLLICKCNCY